MQLDIKRDTYIHISMFDVFYHVVIGLMGREVK